MSTIHTLQDLQQAIARGEMPDYLFFWGHRAQRDGSVGKGCFSQWHEAAFSVEGRTYASAEHFMMAGKAELFGDEEILERILRAATPAEAKALGRKVRGYDEAAWEARRFDIVRTGNLAKFSQHAPLRVFLLATGGKVLVEASPVDRIWGIGLAADHPDAGEPQRWQGLNLLGFALMQVREALRGTEVAGR